MSPTALRWLGAAAMHLDQPHLTECGPIVLGCYGGSLHAGAHKNEDAALIWRDPAGEWEWALIVDAHHSAQSAALLLDTLAPEEEAVRSLLALPIEQAFNAIHGHLLDIFVAPAFRAACAAVEGEASCLIAARKGEFLWWFAVGDCVAYLFHPSLARLGEYGLNQRRFYEWVGRVNTFDLPVPCYSSGTRRLSPGLNTIVLATDGLLECGTRPFENNAILYHTFTWAAAKVRDQVSLALNRVHAELGKDSATVIAWQYDTLATPIDG
jgi:hypothetical protein